MVRFAGLCVALGAGRVSAQVGFRERAPGQ